MQVTVVELPEFIKRSEKLLSTAERNGLIDQLSRYPKTGVAIRGTGGVRKARWGEVAKGRVVEFVLSIFSATRICPSFCSRYLPKISKRI